MTNKTIGNLSSRASSVVNTIVTKTHIRELAHIKIDQVLLSKNVQKIKRPNYYKNN